MLIFLFIAFDISADLTELGRTPVAVVCAGVKSILDIPKTLEVLETQGVTVATVGTTKQFPAFYTPNSGFDVGADIFRECLFLRCFYHIESIPC